jgi:hypothetical protein
MLANQTLDPARRLISRNCDRLAQRASSAAARRGVRLARADISLPGFPGPSE